MAAQIVAARSRHGGAARHAFVVLGAGHMRYGLGTAARVRRRAPDTVERLVLITASGELQLSAADQAASRPIDLSHADLRALARAPGDYLHVLPQPAATALPPGHPPLAQ
jgi:uncharacterized iron-regulated protein